MDQHDVRDPAESAFEATTEAPENSTSEQAERSAEMETTAQAAVQPMIEEKHPTEEETPIEEQPQPATERPAPTEEQAPTEEPRPRVVPGPVRSAARSKPRTKLVCTIGPASAERIRELVELGMDVARVNFSHGTPEEHKQAVDAVRAAAHSARRSVAVLIDLPGRKVRLGELTGNEVELEAGSRFTLRPPDRGSAEGSAEAAETSLPLADDVQPGDRILLADGAVELTVDSTANGEVSTQVVRGGVIRSRAGVNIPSERLTGPALTEADREAVPRALQLKADMIAQSFVRSAADIDELRALLPQGNSAPAIVAKIETRAALDDFEAIAQRADGVMIARGDLGVDLPFEQVPLIQKDLLRRARNAGRFTLVATQMLESMTAAARPTRAEASDVANAVLDGTDAVMLSAETAIGRFPIEAAEAALSICAATERDGNDVLAFPHSKLPDDHPEAIIHAAVESSLRYPGLSAIWCFTRSGQTAEMLSILRPRLPVVAFTLTPIVARRLAVRTGVIPVVLPSARTGEPLIRRMEAAARAQGVQRGGPGGQGSGGQGSSVLLATTSGERGGINRLEIHELG